MNRTPMLTRSSSAPYGALSESIIFPPFGHAFPRMRMRFAGKPGKAHPHARKDVTERGKNDRFTESTVRSVAAAREHGRPVHSAWPLPQGHGVRDGGGRKVFRVPGAAGLVRLGRRDLRDARR